jgi:hypothetical protein
MATQRIVFTEWLPDQPSSVNALVDAKNVMPNQVGYKPFPTAQNYGSAAGEDLIATVSGKFDDVTQLFSGSATKLYQYNGVNHINVSKSSRIISNIERTSNVVTITTTTAHGYSVSDSVVVGATTNTGINGTFTVASVPSTTTFTYAQTGADIVSVADSGRVYRDTYNASQWHFTQFGPNVLATDNNSKVQYWEVNQSVSFEDASADAPVAKYITTVRDFVVTANVGGVANKVQWSDINDFTNWTSGSASQADYQLLPDGNTIQGITGGEFGVIFLEKAIVRMSYIGSPLFFQFDTIARNLGCIASGSIAQFGATSFWLADDGFYSTDGNVVTPIGVEKVDRYFFDNLDYNSLSTISSSIDPVNKLVVWNYPKATGGRELIMYNWQIQRWSRAETDVTTMAYAATATTTLEALDNFGTIDTLPASLDSSIWAGGIATLKGTRGQYIVAFNGSSATANIVTPDLEIGFNSTITLARTQIDNGSSTVQVASRKMLDDTITYSSSVTTDDENRASLRSSGRYHRLSVTPTGNWTSAIGVDVDITPRGLR